MWAALRCADGVLCWRSSKPPTRARAASIGGSVRVIWAAGGQRTPWWWRRRVGTTPRRPVFQTTSNAGLLGPVCMVLASALGAHHARMSKHRSLIRRPPVWPSAWDRAGKNYLSVSCLRPSWQPALLGLAAVRSLGTSDLCGVPTASFACRWSDRATMAKLMMTVTPSALRCATMDGARPLSTIKGTS